MVVAGGAHALHDGYTDIVLIMLPIWQAEFGLGYAAVGMLRSCLTGTMASLQIPASLLSERFGVPKILAGGTALAGLGYLLAGASSGFFMLMVALLICGAGTSVQHPLASALVARTFAGARSLKALGIYNFLGDIGKMSLPAVTALMLVVAPWQPTLATLGALGLIGGVAILVFTPRAAAEPPTTSVSPAGAEVPVRQASLPACPTRTGFYLLLGIGIVDSGVRMAFLTFLPFVLVAKGAPLPMVGLALTLVFAGGAAGKLVCAFVGARIGIIATVCLTEILTTVGILALLPLSLDITMFMLPIVGVALNGTSSVLYGSVPLLVDDARRARAFSIFYTGVIGSGAAAPILFGALGDLVGVPTALVFVAGLCLASLPLAMTLRRALPPHAR